MGLRQDDMGETWGDWWSSKEKSAQDPKSLRSSPWPSLSPPCRRHVLFKRVAWSCAREGEVSSSGVLGSVRRQICCCRALLLVHAGPARDGTWLEAVGGEDSPCPVIETSPTGNTWWTGQRRIRQWKRERFGAAFHGVMLGRREPREPHFLLMRLLSMPKKKPYSHTDWYSERLLRICKKSKEGKRIRCSLSWKGKVKGAFTEASSFQTCVNLGVFEPILQRGDGLQL